MIPASEEEEEVADVRRMDMARHLGEYPKKRYVEWELRDEPCDDVPDASPNHEELPAPVRYMLENKRMRITDKQFKCDTCWKGFDTERELAAHVKLHERKSSAKGKKKCHKNHTHEYEKIIKLLEKNA